MFLRIFRDLVGLTTPNDDEKVLYSLLSVRIVFRDIQLTYNDEGLCLKRIQYNIFERFWNAPLSGFEITSFKFLSIFRCLIPPPFYKILILEKAVENNPHNVYIFLIA